MLCSAAKVLYPGCLAFYRELDLGARGPERWPEGSVGNLVFLSARPHMYKDMSEKQNFAKFAKLIERGMHTNPSLLCGDVKSGSEYMMMNDMEPLAVKKFTNFAEYVAIYPEFSHVFVGDNGQGDVRGGELMHERFPDKLEMLYIHKVQPISKTHGYDAERYRKIGLSNKVCFFATYVDAGVDAVKRGMIKKSGLRRICLDAVKDFHHIGKKQWPSKQSMISRRNELNQAIWRANEYLLRVGRKTCPLILSSPRYNINERVSTKYGAGWVRSYDPVHDLYRVDLDWRPLDEQLAEYKDDDERSSAGSVTTSASLMDASVVKSEASNLLLDTVIEGGKGEERESYEEVSKRELL